MSSKAYMFLVLFLVSCGGVYTATLAPIEIHIDPIKIDLTATISYGDLLTGFKVECRQELGSTASDIDVSNCASLKLSTLLEDIGNAATGH